jgi:hypothetical protein
MLVTMRKKDGSTVKLHDTDASYNFFVSEGFKTVMTHPEAKPIQLNNPIKRRNK